MIRPIKNSDRSEYIKMCCDFYSTDAVMHPVDVSHFENCFDLMMQGNPYAFALIIENDSETAGFALFAQTYSQEAGGMVLWLEELYLKPEHRGKKLGNEFFEYLMRELAPNYRRLRLEAEDYNTRALSLYRKFEFEELPYMPMYVEK